MEESEENPVDTNLPEKYTYHEVSQTPKEWNFRIVEVRDESAAEDWLKEYSELTKTTWRVARTYTYGKFNLFKKDYRCSHLTDRRATGQRSSKHTGCQASLGIVIKKFIEKAKRQDMLNQTHPCIVRIKNKHNHALTSPSSLKHRDLSPNVREKFINLYHQGYTPISAFKRHKADLMIEKGNEFNEAAVDGKIMPTLSKVAHLFKKEFIKTHGGLSGYKDMLKARRRALKSEVTKQNTSPQQIPLLTGSYSLADLRLPSAWSDVQDKNENLHKNYTENEGKRAVQNLLMEHETLPIRYSEVDPQLPSLSSPSHDVTGDWMSQDESDPGENSEEFKESLSFLEGFFNRIKEGIRSKPEIFLPAVEKLKENVSKYAAAETGMINALHTFGMPSDVQGTLKQNSAEKMRKDYPMTIIILPPTSTHHATYGTRYAKICPMPSERREGPYILQLNKAKTN